MRAMVLKKQGTPLELQEVPEPTPAPHEVRLRVKACGICRTDLHVVDGDLKHPKLPLIPGHQIVGEVESVGKKVKDVKKGQRVGVPWLGGSCKKCTYCQNDQENLCDQARYTGYQIDGGFAEYCVADADFVFPLPESYSDAQAAPLLCAGLIGYRALRMTEGGEHLGFYGFGASAHILCQLAASRGGKVYAFVRPGDTKSARFAKSLGAVWAGSSEEPPPHQLDAAIIFAPIGSLVVSALKAVRKGGIVVCAGIHMSDIPSFPYALLWEERQIRSVANLTRKDGREFLALAPNVPIQTEVTEYPLERANEALADLREGSFHGAAVIAVDQIKK